MEPETDAVEAFITRWEASDASERANAPLFLTELCDVLGLEHPDPAGGDNAYVFERDVTFQKVDGSTAPGRIDLYKRDCFVLEAKQGSHEDSAKVGHGRRGTPAWEQAMIKARNQADRYIRALPAEEGRPPFLMVVDVGHQIEVFAEFSCTGGTYIPFPSPGTHRIPLSDLRMEEVRNRLRAIWTDPQSLDPSRRAARVTREVADRLAKLAVSLEGRGESPEDVAHFLMRALFTMFAEDVGLLGGFGHQPFTQLLTDMADDPEGFVPLLEELWGQMNRGGYSAAIRQRVLQFNGGLFAENTALTLDKEQIRLLREAAECDWRDVEPAIFGTLLERALDPRERHKLGAHYTPRAYVERLVMPTVIQPLREEWASVQDAAVILDADGNTKAAVKELKAFHARLCDLRVLDPACGSGNFLYVVLEHLKRIEGEVLDTLDGMGERQSLLDLHGTTVDPHQLLGIEINPRAAAIAELVLWIGTLQWHFRTRGRVMPPEPIIRDFRNIECRDALISYDTEEPLLDEHGDPVTQWDGHTMKKHPVTGKDVPDESARKPVFRYVNPKKAEWPEADYIVGNPPYLGARVIRAALSDSYLKALRTVYTEIPDNVDFVMYWWHKAALEIENGNVKIAGLITTNSITQAFCKKLIESHLKKENPISFAYTLHDHPWVDASDGASVRVSMNCIQRGVEAGVRQSVLEECPNSESSYDVVLSSELGIIDSDFRIGVSVVSAKELQSNKGVSCVGYQLSGQGFILDPEDRDQLVIKDGEALQMYIHKLLGGRSVTQAPKDVWALDFFGITESEVMNQFPAAFQWLLERVKPERDQNNRRAVRENWWLYGECRSTFRPALIGLKRMLVTSLTAKHRAFVFESPETVADSTTVMFSLDDAFFHGVMSSRYHVLWALSMGGTLEDRPRYNKTRCFETFPFPDAPPRPKKKKFAPWPSNSTPTASGSRSNTPASP